MSNAAGKLLLFGAMMGTGLLTRRAVGEVWEETTGNAPPRNPAAEGVSWGDALVWAATASLAVGLARTAVRRALAEPADSIPLEE